MRVGLTLLGLAAFALSAAGEVAGLLEAGLPGEDAALVEGLRGSLEEAGYEVSPVDAAGLCGGLSGLDLLVLPDGSRLPADSVGPLEAYLRRGGDIIALNAPLWRTVLVQVDGKWLSREEYARSTAAELPENLLFDFAEGSTDAWLRNTSEAGAEATYETVADGPAPGRRSLHVRLGAYRGWDTFGPELLEQPFPAGHTLTVFAAKGGPDTHSLAVEWREKDGCRWIATAPLTTEWRQYVLAPEDFKFWESDPARRNDTFRPENAATMRVGLALTHTGPGGLSQEYWVSGFGTSPMTAERARLLAEPRIPKLDGLSPGYKSFESTGVAELVSVLAGRADLPEASVMRSAHPRPSGGGFDKGRAWRWMPLVEARSTPGAWRGVPGAMTAHAEGTWQGGQWASFGVQGTDWYRRPEVMRLLRDVAARMRRGLCIIDGGADFYTYFEEQTPRVGLRIANLGAREQKATARVAVTPIGKGRRKPVFRKEWPVVIGPGGETRVEAVWRPAGWRDEGFLVEAELLEGGRAIDSVSHEIHVWRPKKKKEFVAVENGDFVLGGRRWRAHGVNYMPSTGIAAEDRPYFEYWLGVRSYDPVAIDRDLDHIVDMGLNSVSIFLYRRDMESQNLLDLLRRLEQRGLKANLSLRPGTPVDFQWDGIREMIAYYRLPENDTVFAYDLAWEPMWMFQKDRRRWDADWEAWVIERYGSIGNAERDWAWPIPRDENGAVTNPPTEHTDEDGEWRGMVAAYRRFLDTLLYKYYSRARRLVRSVDPNHLVSFRMTEAGDPTMSWRGVMPYDFPYLAAAVDIFEPEAYGRIGDWEKVKPGWFEYEYARWASPELPVMWAEAGVSAWDLGPMRSTEAKLAFQGEYFGHIYRMLIHSGADGIFWWWYPGGFRANERSDYGIINADGSDRPATRAIREHTEAFLNGPPARGIDYWIDIDRDRRADGVPGIYRLAGDAFWHAVDTGHAPGLNTAGTGTTSADCPLTAIGGTKCDGTNPPKYLDAFIDAVEVVEKDGPFVRVEVTNLGEAEWVKEGAGAVCLAVEGEEQIALIPLSKNVPPRKSAVFLFQKPKNQVQLSFICRGRMALAPKLVFGPKLVFDP